MIDVFRRTISDVSTVSVDGAMGVDPRDNNYDSSESESVDEVEASVLSQVRYPCVVYSSKLTGELTQWRKINAKKMKNQKISSSLANFCIVSLLNRLRDCLDMSIQMTEPLKVCFYLDT